MTNAVVEQVVGNDADTSIPEVEQAVARLSKAQFEVERLETALESHRASMAQVATSGDIAAITQIAMAIVVILSPEGDKGQLVDARVEVEKATKALEDAKFNARWSLVAGKWDAIRDVVKSMVTPELAKATLETGFTSISLITDGFDNLTGANVSISKRRATGASSTSSDGSRASRTAAWVKGSERFDSAIDVLKAHGHEHSAAKSFNGILNGKTYEASPAGWVAGKVEYAKDASKLARDLGFAPEEAETPASAPTDATPV